MNEADVLALALMGFCAVMACRGLGKGHGCAHCSGDCAACRKAKNK